MVERLCERVIVMAEGSVLAEGSMRSIRENADVVDAYLGTVV
jgi:branched-chain amino acid transport system ATP-binding protein